MCVRRDGTESFGGKWEEGSSELPTVERENGNTNMKVALELLFHLCYKPRISESASVFFSRCP